MSALVQTFAASWSISCYFLQLTTNDLLIAGSLLGIIIWICTNLVLALLFLCVARWSPFLKDE